MSNQFIVAQTTFVEGPGKRLQVCNTLTDALDVQKNWQRTTKDTISVSEIITAKWYIKVVLFLEKLLKS